MLFVLALALLVGCTNAATGGTGSGSETENDYLAPLLGTWKTEGYDEGKFVEMEQGPGTIWEVRCSYKFTKEKIIKIITVFFVCIIIKNLKILEKQKKEIKDPQCMEV